MIDPSTGRDDLQYRYHVTIETCALLTDRDQEAFANNGDTSHMSDPDFESRFLPVDWVRIQKVSLALSSTEAVREYIQKNYGPFLDIEGDIYHTSKVMYLREIQLCRSSFYVAHQATVSREEFMPSIQWHDAEGK